MSPIAELTKLLSHRWPEVVTFILVVGRVGGLMVSAPFWGGRVVPVLVRVWVAVLLAAAIYPVTQPGPWRESIEVFPVVTAMVGEIFFGVLLGWMSQLFFAGMRLAGQEIEIKLGLGLISLADPHEGGQHGVFAAFLELLAAMIFFAVNGHHEMIRALSASYTVVPIGADKFTVSIIQTLVTSAGQMFSIALRVSAPVITGLLLSDIILGILSRAIPQMNLFMVAQPIQFGLGLVLLMFSLPALVWFCVRHVPAMMMLRAGG